MQNGKHTWVEYVGPFGGLLTGIAGVVALLKGLHVLAALIGGVCLGLAGPVLVYMKTLRRTRGIIGGLGSQVTRDSFLVRTERPKTKQEYSVYHLKKRVGPTERRALNWVTFLEGCEALTDWVRDRVEPGLYVGMNPCGIMVASYIRSKLNHNRVPFATYLTSPARPGQPDQLQGMPAKDQFKRGPVLLVDSRIKTGDTGREAAKAVKNHLGGDVELWYVCLLACGITHKGVRNARRASKTGNGDAIPIEFLFTNDSNTCVQVKELGEYSPHGVAYVGEGIIELPSKLR